MSLDSRISTLEESIGNSSVGELEVRMETLEGTTTNHETRLSALETDAYVLQSDQDSNQDTNKVLFFLSQI